MGEKTIYNTISINFFLNVDFKLHTIFLTKLHLQTSINIKEPASTNISTRNTI